MRVSSLDGSSERISQSDPSVSVDRARLIGGLRHEARSRIAFAEFQVGPIHRRESGLADDHRDGPDLLHSSVGGVQLRGPARMIRASAMLADSVLHETRERGQNVDRRIDSFAVQCVG